MIVLDANILLYAYDSESALHSTARSWLERILSGTEPVAIPWQSVLAFLRISTNPRLAGERFSMEEAGIVVDAWHAQPNVRFIGPGEQHWATLRRLMVDGQAKGPLLTDAHLASLTIECGGILHTTDKDFARFAGLRWLNPLS
ncbi:MAG: PIN domain-containing protein [Bryobacterales bacterium]|nr:PIN domain-containing protein [Bryobacterales bacterium]